MSVSRWQTRRQDLDSQETEVCREKKNQREKKKDGNVVVVVIERGRGEWSLMSSAGRVTETGCCGSSLASRDGDWQTGVGEQASILSEKHPSM